MTNKPLIPDYQEFLGSDKHGRYYLVRDGKPITGLMSLRTALEFESSVIRSLGKEYAPYARVSIHRKDIFPSYLKYWVKKNDK